MSVVSPNSKWLEGYFNKAVEFLSKHFGVTKPKTVLHCEQVCMRGGSCGYLACYWPWDNRINVKSGSEKGFIAAHELGHGLQKAGMLEEGEDPAMAMEAWWFEKVDELSCQVCGAPLFIMDDTTTGTILTCDCGARYEAYRK